MDRLSKYERFYREQDNVCGDPFPEFIEFANSHCEPSAKVLDLGCGQGRDALLFARAGMSVVGVDIAPTGIRQMVEAAKLEALSIDGIVGDVRTFESDSSFDVIILDRTLHMLREVDDRIDVLDRCSAWLEEGGHILIADERSNIPAFEKWFENDERDWQFKPGMKPSFCFAQRVH